MTVARYDGHADWYDDWRKPQVASAAHDLAELLGPGEGLCLDLGCGTGLFLDPLAATGRTAVGLDRSADQLRVASGRSRRILQADAAALPFRDGTFTAVAALWISTDVDDFGAVLAEAARVLTPGECSCSTARTRASTARTSSGWKTAASGRTRPTGRRDGTRRRHGGASMSASGSG
jgi:ubiquinone/menaquinone biosynthesis C-methylase UbiE